MPLLHLDNFICCFFGSKRMNINYQYIFSLDFFYFGKKLSKFARQVVFSYQNDDQTDFKERYEQVRVARVPNHRINLLLRPYVSIIMHLFCCKN